MADLIRVTLFALALAAIAFSSVVIAGRPRLGATGSVLALSVVGAGQVVLLAEVLSLLQALDWPGFLLGHLLGAGVTAAWLRRHPSADAWRALHEIRDGAHRLAPLVAQWRTPALPIMTGATLLVGLTSGVVALWVPPNNVDSLAYHMTRVGFYLQFSSLEHYPTANLFQVVFPVNAELLILWSVAFLRSDRLANAVQLAAWALTMAAVYGLGRQVGFGPRAALFAAGAFGLLPQPVLQSTSAHNDLVVAGFLASGLFFLLQAASVSRPASRLALAGAAVGLAVGTKGTALLALPGLAIVFLLLFGRCRRPRVRIGALAGGVLAALLGSFMYVQNWYQYGSPFGPPLVSRLALIAFPTVSGEATVSTLARTLYAFAFADLSGPLADPRALPMTVHLVEWLASVGERFFAVLAIPVEDAGADDDAPFPPFAFARMPVVDDYRSGVGLVGGLIVVSALVASLRPTRVEAGHRLLGLATLSYLGVLSLVLDWNAFGGGRFLVTACALGAPLLASLAGWSGTRPGRVSQTVALCLAVWSGATGLYVAWFNHYRPVLELAGRDRLALTFPDQPVLLALFHEIDRELGPDATVGVYVDPGRYGLVPFQEYPLFGPRFTRTLVPLVDADYAERLGLRRPLAWTTERLLDEFRPSYVIVRSGRPGAEQLPHVIPGRCVEVPLRHGKPTVPVELWRCDARDPPARSTGGG